MIRPTFTRRHILGLASLALLPFGNEARAKAQATHWHGKALGAAAELIFYHDDPAQAQHLLKRIAAEISRLEAILSPA